MPTTTLKGSLRSLDSWEYDSVDSIGTTRDKIADEYAVIWTNGTGDNQINGMYRFSGSLLGNTETAFDLAGSLTDVFGNTLTFATIKDLKLTNLATTATDALKLGQLSTPTSGNLLTDIFDGVSTARVKVNGGGQFHLVSPLTGYTVTGGSADVILVSNEGANAISYELVVKGVLA